MAKRAQIPDVKVAVSVILRGERILLGYNDPWDAFSLPMTKPRAWNSSSPGVRAVVTEEPDARAAARAAAEWLGRTVRGLVEVDVDLPPFQQSDREGVWKRYHFRVFTLNVADTVQARPGAMVDWLTADEILDDTREPISPTARKVVNELRMRGVV